ncbi:MAG TPA: hypothetical protein VFS05_04295 [Gemmatimonadaceae bacterium]|nr:hypothetical protein [Gemmatimonadaceae bacterium]
MRSEPRTVPTHESGGRVERAVLDVSHLPTVVFGHRSTMWWGIVCFMLIEGTTLALCAASYIYVRRNFNAWPPERTPLPDLTVASVNMLVMLASVLPAYLCARAAKRLDLAGVKRWLVVMALFGIVILVLRWFEMRALHTRWDANAYGSVADLVIFVHATLLLVDVADTIVFTVIAFSDRFEKKHFPDATDNSFYWYFMVLSWLPLYLLLFWGPRWF